jgi:hypothetical protein
MSEMVQDKESTDNVAASAKDLSHSRTFLNATTEEGSLSFFLFQS